MRLVRFGVCRIEKVAEKPFPGLSPAASPVRIAVGDIERRLIEEQHGELAAITIHLLPVAARQNDTRAAGACNQGALFSEPGLRFPRVAVVVQHNSLEFLTGAAFVNEHRDARGNRVESTFLQQNRSEFVANGEFLVFELPVRCGS